MAPRPQPIGTEPWTAQWTESRARLPGAGLPWLVRLREAGIERFQNLGLPTNRDEAWKYSSLRPLSRLPFAAAPEAPSPETPAPGLAPEGLLSRAHRLVFVDGRFVPQASAIGDLPDGVVLGSLAELLATRPALLEGRLGSVAPQEAQPMLALNTALMADGWVLILPAGAELDRPVELVFQRSAGTPAAAHPRGLVVAERGAQALIVESHRGGEGGALSNGGVEILAGPGASIAHAKIQDEAGDAWHLWQHHVRLERDARFASTVLTLGARFSTNRIAVGIAGSGVDCRLDGAYLLQGRQHADHTTQIEHAAPNASSRQVYKGVLSGQSRGVFQGEVIVRREAQKTDAHQLNRNLLLSAQAEADSKPMLEIYADDVKCSHGATIGDLDPDHLFYMRARGIPETDARRLLIDAFVAECFSGLPEGELLEAFADRARRWQP